MEKIVVIKKTVAYLSLLIIFLYVITGYGITKEETMSKITFGILTKSISYKIHTHLIIPLILLIIGHLFLALNLQEKFKREKELNRL